MSFYTFKVFFIGALKHYLVSYSPITHEEYADRNFYVQQCLGTVKGRYFEKIEWGLDWPRMKSLKIVFFVIFKTILLPAY
jgi:hypothetical protein